MDEIKAREILGRWVKDDDSLSSLDPYINANCEDASLDGGFTADQLEAMAWWMRNKLT